MSVRFRQGVTGPPAYLIDRFRDPIIRVASVWATLGRFVDVEITSWWRDEARNLAAGGKPYSQHLAGTAIDGVIVGLSRAAALPYVTRMGARFGVTVPAAPSEGSGASVHVQGLAVGMVEKIIRSEPSLLVNAARGFVGPPRPTPV